MERNKIVLLAGIPLAAVLLVAAMLVLRGRANDAASEKPATVKTPTAATPVKSATIPPPPKPASPEKIAAATDLVRVRGTYQNYRTAVATNNTALRDSLLPVLLKDRAAARQCAEEDLARAQSDLDRNIATKVMETLR